MERLALIQLLFYVIFPLWVLAGLADWWCHRRSHIETSSGLKESLIHSLMLIEIAVPVLLGLFFEITPAILLFMVACLILHEITTLWDVSLATKQRYISPLEQHIHSFLELLPFCALLIVCALHWEAVQSLPHPSSYPIKGLQLKASPIPFSYLLPLLTAITVLLVLPFGEELVRTHKARYKKVPPTL